MTQFYDPPEGWKFGFPKPYAPLPEENFEQTLLRDGYPRHLRAVAMIATSFWETNEGKDEQLEKREAAQLEERQDSGLGNSKLERPIRSRFDRETY